MSNSSFVTINDSRCYARKKSNLNERCVFKNQINIGCVFCKKHQNSKNVIRFDEPIPTKPTNTINTINGIIKLSNIDKIKYYKVSKASLIESAKFHNLDFTGKKKEIYDRLFNHLLSLKKYNSFDSEIIVIQKWYRKKKQIYINKLRGPISNKNFNPINDTDFLTFENISDIDKSLLFSYNDNKSNGYVFDIRSLNELLKNSNINPYTRDSFPDYIKKHVNIIFNDLKKRGKLNLTIQDDNELNDAQKIKHEIIEIFDKMDNLDQYTNPDWFLELNLKQLHMFYKELEDIWNYRLNLTKQAKSKIIPPNGILFTLTPKYVSSIKDKIHVQEICLEIINRLISSSSNRSDRVSGCMYVIFALVIVSKSAAEALPIYYNMVGNNLEVNSDVFYMI